MAESERRRRESGFDPMGCLMLVILLVAVGAAFFFLVDCAKGLAGR